MIKFEGRQVGILGTVIIHLIAGILFMSFQIKTMQKDTSEKFEVGFAPEEETAETKVKVKLVELPATSIERILKGDDEMLNIARNLANKSVEKINPADVIDNVKNELIKSGKLGIDNYIDEQKKLSEPVNEEKIVIENDTVKKTENQKPAESQKKEANYKGPTRIYYNLSGRNHTFLPLPIYKCEGSGKIVLSIEVNQKGEVEKALIIAKESTTSDLCLVETAVQTALLSRFNADISSSKIQTGTLSYQFVAQ